MKTEKQIRLTQEAYVEGYAGAFLRKINADGTPSIYGLWDNWYTATAEDAEENEYTVYWAMRDDYDASESEGDESDACNWDNPYMILDADNKNILDNPDFKITLELN
jgi:hypothetical protein